MAAETGQLQLVTPTQGTLSGAWGNTVNNGITEYVNIAIAGTLSFAGDGAITLANTVGTSSATNIGATTAQYMVIRVTGTLTTTKTITGPSYSKIYLVDNAATGGSVAFQRSGQVTPVTVTAGTRAFVYYNGTDYVTVAGGLINLASGVTGTLPVANGGTGVSTSTGTGNTVLSASPTLTGVPLAPTAAVSTNTTQIATTAFVQAQIGAIGAGVTSVTASAPLASSGGSTPNITLSGALPTANGGTGNIYGIAVSAPLLQTTNFSISEVGGVLVFKYGATTIASMTSAGVFTTLSDINSNGTP
jgi:hypothetical protein